MINLLTMNSLLIPKELSTASLPFSFRYYDPVMAIINE